MSRAVRIVTTASKVLVRSLLAPLLRYSSGEGFSSTRGSVRVSFSSSLGFLESCIYFSDGTLLSILSHQLSCVVSNSSREKAFRVEDDGVHNEIATSIHVMVDHLLNASE